jgi:integrase
VTRAAAPAAAFPTVPHMPHVAHTLKRLLPGTFQDQVQITKATRMLRDAVPVEVVSKVLGHSSAATTSAVYGHLSAADARKALKAAGWFTGTEVTL